MSEPYETDELDQETLVYIGATAAPYIRLTDNVRMVEVDEHMETVTVHGEAPRRIISMSGGLATWFDDDGAYHVPTGPAYIEAAVRSGIPVVYV